MALVTLEEAKEYLRVDSADEDAMTDILLSAAERMCADVARLSDEKWAAVDSDTEDGSLTPIRETMKVAILYALGYLLQTVLAIINPSGLTISPAGRLPRIRQVMRVKKLRR